MKKLIFLLAAGLMAGNAISQDLPQPSPFSKVEQTVGLTKISIEYSRPSVKGRTIFGDLVPYGEVWRLGANACTKITASTDFILQGEKIKAGTYAVFAIPNEGGMWQILINTDTEQWGAGNYDATKNVAVVDVKAPEGGAFTENLTISISNVMNNSAVISIAWATTHVDISLDVDTDKIAQANIDEAIKKGEDLDKVYYRAASYYYSILNDEKKALVYIQKGLVVKEGHALYFLRAEILQKQGHNKEALEYAQKAYDLAMASENKGWADYIKSSMDSWKK